uniref:geranylgeranylglyceryl/heptaprenylglyceryl phosphate synthase n=1 Tax=Roseivirga sp. TaxID=1964215 RepID=UPI0040475C45
MALLVDPDDLNEGGMKAIVNAAIENKVDYFLVGGSLITSNNLESVVDAIKAFSTIPCILFPGNAIQIHPEADAILFLSLISGRNPELLIGQHVVAAPVLKRSNLEIIPTGYILIHSGRPTSVSYMSNTQPIPNDKPSLAISTAMAGEMLGLKCIYMDAGSGALEPVSAKVIKSVKRNIDIPLIIGGGINSKRKAQEALEAGADMIVIGNGAQKNLSLLAEVSDVIQYLNETLNVN